MKLKLIVENLEKMPSTLKGFNESPKLSPEQKRKLMEMVRQYNSLGQKLRIENSLMETAQALAEIAELAETYACNEASDWFATEVIKQDFKRAKGISETFQKLSRDCYGKVQQLNALYEDMGNILGRYYEIADPMQEVAPNPTNIKGQRELPHTSGPSGGQLKEVEHNESNLQSQRELPQGGPTPCDCPNPENPSVPVNPAGSGEMDVKGERDVPQRGPSKGLTYESFKFSDILKTFKK